MRASRCACLLAALLQRGPPSVLAGSVPSLIFVQEPSDDENDMLDLAFGLTRTSRLGCQVVADKAIDGIVVRLPAVRLAVTPRAHGGPNPVS